MIATTKVEDGYLMSDQAEALKAEAGVEVLDLVKFAMASGLTEFTTPTTADGEGRIDWKVKRFFTTRKGKPVCHLVACKVLFEHFEVVGPEVDLAAQSGELKIPVPVKR